MLDDAIGARTATQSQAAAEAAPREASVPCGPILAAADIAGDPHFAARGMHGRHRVPGLDGEVTFPGVVPKLTERPGRTRGRIDVENPERCATRSASPRSRHHSGDWSAAACREWSGGSIRRPLTTAGNEISGFYRRPSGTDSTMTAAGGHSARLTQGYVRRFRSVQSFSPHRRTLDNAPVGDPGWARIRVRRRGTRAAAQRDPGAGRRARVFRVRHSSRIPRPLSRPPPTTETETVTNGS
ncbi:CoA transferase [Amycolatopsis stemonae]